MKQGIYEYLQTTGTLSAQTIFIGFAAAFIIGMVIFASYRFSHTRAVYSAKFNASLVMLTLVSTLIMSVIGNNVALSLGMVGALSIVRFRTAVKDPRDTAYIFWCIAAGVCCGVQDFMVASIGTAVIFVVMLFIGNVRDNDRFLLIVRGKKGISNFTKEEVNKYYSGKARLCVVNATTEQEELIYELSENTINKAAKNNKGGKQIEDILWENSEITAVNLVCQSDEITR